MQAPRCRPTCLAEPACFEKASAAPGPTESVPTDEAQEQSFPTVFVARMCAAGLRTAHSAAETGLSSHGMQSTTLDFPRPRNTHGRIETGQIHQHLHLFEKPVQTPGLARETSMMQSKQSRAGTAM